MIKKNLHSILFGLLFILTGTICVGQIVDFDNENPYKKVFVDTDNFGVSYLDILQESIDKVDNDTYKVINVTARNTLGQVVLTKTYKSTNQLSLDIDSAKGLYFVEIRTDEGESSMFKIVKK
jgi:S-adenosylmethionine hydrolase